MPLCRNTVHTVHGGPRTVGHPAPTTSAVQPPPPPSAVVHIANTCTSPGWGYARRRTSYLSEKLLEMNTTREEPLSPPLHHPALRYWYSIRRAGHPPPSRRPHLPPQHTTGLHVLLNAFIRLYKRRPPPQLPLHRYILIQNGQDHRNGEENPQLASFHSRMTPTTVLRSGTKYCRTTLVIIPKIALFHGKPPAVPCATTTAKVPSERRRPLRYFSVEQYGN